MRERAGGRWKGARGPREREFRYGVRLRLTVPLVAMFVLVAIEMAYLAGRSASYLRVFDCAVAALACALALGVGRAVLVRARGKRRIVVGKSELTAPVGAGDEAVRYRDMRAVEITGAGGFKRNLRIEHTAGTLVISGLWLATTRELDELAALVRSARKAR